MTKQMHSFKKTIYYVITNLGSELIIQLTYASPFWQIKFYKVLMRVTSKEHSAQLVMKFFLKKLSLGLLWRMHYMVSVISFRKNIFYKYRQPTFWPWKNSVPQGSTLGPLMLLIYVNDIPQALNSNLFLYADNSCLMFQQIKTLKKCITQQLWKHFGKDKILILFASQHKIKNIKTLYKVSEHWNKTAFTSNLSRLCHRWNYVWRTFGFKIYK